MPMRSTWGALLLIRFVIRSLRASRLVVLLTVCDDDTIDDSIRGVIDDISSDGRTLRPLPITGDHVDQLLTADGATSMQAVCDQRIHRLRAPEREVIAADRAPRACSSRDWIAEITASTSTPSRGDRHRDRRRSAHRGQRRAQGSAPLRDAHRSGVVLQCRARGKAQPHSRGLGGSTGPNRSSASRPRPAPDRRAALLGSRVEIDRATRGPNSVGPTAAADGVRDRIGHHHARIGLYDGASSRSPSGCCSTRRGANWRRAGWPRRAGGSVGLPSMPLHRQISRSLRSAWVACGSTSTATDPSTPRS